ncbi:Uu.00g031940.m01.CDS01 [Anthostomella pinea]|uniref:Uu.00g031940.m01.CDS01 n=1 Tax=Anthostomella pinea TaxID=933095 RepID=A0AAI8YD16_9PEZI|nr:Uu.00g031940.m01.CDS01 [Anthostomella pinea]
MASRPRCAAVQKANTAVTDMVDSDNHTGSRTRRTMSFRSSLADPTPNDTKGSKAQSMLPDDQKPRSDSASTPDGAQPSTPLRKTSHKKAPQPAMIFKDLPEGVLPGTETRAAPAIVRR